MKADNGIIEKAQDLKISYVPEVMPHHIPFTIELFSDCIEYYVYKRYCKK